MNQIILSKARDDLYEKVFESSYEISDLIPPEDVDEDAESWSDVSDADMDAEIMDALHHAGPTEHNEGAIKEFAIKIWMADMPRVPMEDLAFDSKEKAVKEGYWPYKMDRWECEDLLWEQEIKAGCYAEAHDVAQAAYIDAFDPRAEKQESL